MAGVWAGTLPVIRTYTQLASVSPAKVAALVAGPSAEQITKQDWIGQARELALQQKSAKLRTNETVLPGDLHRVNFRVELVLTEDNDVHHTNVMHIQSRGKDNWASWQIKPLIDFFVQHAGLHLPPTELVFPVATTAAPAAPTESPPLWAKRGTRLIHPILPQVGVKR